MSIDPATLPAGLRAFVEDDVALLPSGLDARERELLVSVLLERADLARLDRLGASPDKALAKQARRAIHILRTRGRTEAPGPRVFRVAGPYAAEADVPSQASIIDGRGERIVWYVAPREGGYSIFEAELSETAGVLSLTAIDVTRKAWRDQLAHMRRSERALTAAIPGAHARVLIERSYRAMVADGRSPPEAFARFHREIQASDEELAAPHPLRALTAALPAPSDAELTALLERPELALLVPPQEAVAALDRAIGEVLTSQLVLEPAQRLARLESALVRVADEALDGRMRARYADRFLELGLLALARQPDDAGRAAARACVAAADLALDGAVPCHAHPTLIAMYRRLVPAERLMQLAEER